MEPLKCKKALSLMPCSFPVSRLRVLFRIGSPDGDPEVHEGALPARSGGPQPQPPGATGHPARVPADKGQPNHAQLQADRRFYVQERQKRAFCVSRRHPAVFVEKCRPVQDCMIAKDAVG